MDALGKQIAEEAADWLLRLEETPSGRHDAEFVAWLKRSPRHMDEFLTVEASYRTVQRFFPRDRVALASLIEQARGDEVVPLREELIHEALPAKPGRNTGRTLRWLASAAVAAAAIGVALFVSQGPASPEYLTGTGEQRTFKLPDGSLLNLNTQSRASIHFTRSAREVRLKSGEALFNVKQDPSRPFRVMTDTAVVQAVGTAFNVYRRADESTVVSVVEGRVKVSTQSAYDAERNDAAIPVPLAAGEEVKVSASRRLLPREKVDVDRTISWRQRRLVFRDTELSEAVAQFNRYNADIQLRLAGTALARRHITGTFDADEPRAFLRFLAEDPSVRLESRQNEVLIEAR